MIFFGSQFSRKGNGRVRSIDNKKLVSDSSSTRSSGSEREENNLQQSPRKRRKISSAEIQRAVEETASQDSLNVPDIETDLHSITDPIDQMYRQYGISK